MNKLINVGVLMGGRIIQHEMSLANGMVVLNYLNKNIYNIKPIKIAMDKTWWVLDGYISQDDIKNSNFISFTEMFKKFQSRFLQLNMGHALEKIIYDKVDVIFIALQGSYGEEGLIQSVFELSGIPYTGSRPLTCALATNKIKSKEIFTFHNINSPKHLIITQKLWNTQKKGIINKVKAELRFPCIVKPPKQNSSIGICVPKSEKEFILAIHDIFNKYDNKVLVEEYIIGTEVTCAVMESLKNNNNPFVLHMVELLPQHSFFDYYTKYDKSLSTEVFPPRIHFNLNKQAKEIAIKSYNAIDCSGLARIDIIISGNTIYVLEINTIPAMTYTEFYHEASKSINTDFSGLLAEIIELAIQKSYTNLNYDKKLESLQLPYINVPYINVPSINVK